MSIRPLLDAFTDLRLQFKELKEMTPDEASASLLALQGKVQSLYGRLRECSNSGHGDGSSCSKLERRLDKFSARLEGYLLGRVSPIKSGRESVESGKESTASRETLPLTEYGDGGERGMGSISLSLPPLAFTVSPLAGPTFVYKGEVPPSCGEVFARERAKEDFLGDVVKKVESLEEPARRHLSLVWQTVSKDLLGTIDPEIARMAAASALHQIALVELDDAVAMNEVFSTVFSTAKTDHPPLPAFDVAGLETAHLSFRAVFDTFEESEKMALRLHLRSLLYLAPFLEPVNLYALFGQLALQERLPEINWAGDIQLQLMQLLYFANTPLETPISRTIAEAAKTKESVLLRGSWQEIKRKLFAVGEGISCLSSEQRLFASKQILKHYTGWEWSDEQAIGLYEALSEVELSLPTLDCPSVEGYDELYLRIRTSLSEENMARFRTDMLYLITVADELSPDVAFSIADSIVREAGLGAAAWTAESPRMQLSRWLYLTY